MRARIQAHDWSHTPLGSPSAWPRSLSSAIEIMLGSRHPTLVWWGPDLVQLYNDACVPLLGSRHPWDLGQPAAHCWADAWAVFGRQADAVMDEGVSSRIERFEMAMTRNGFPEEVYMTFSYGPVLDDAGSIRGVFCTGVEETPRVLGDRRLAMVAALGDRTAKARTTGQACDAVAAVLADNPRDLPFALLYLLDEGQQTARLAAMTGIERPVPADLVRVEPGERAAWPFREVSARGVPVHVDALRSRPVMACKGAWPEPPRDALVLPLARTASDGLAGFLVAGISPRLVFDDSYRTFLGLLARQIATALGAVAPSTEATAASARAFEREAVQWLPGPSSKSAFRGGEHNKYRALFQAMGQGYCELELVRDAQGRAVDLLCLEFNPTFERLSGIPVVQAEGRRASDVLADLDPIWTQTFGRVAATGKPERIEYEMASLRRWFEVFAYPRGGDRVVVLYDEITDRKRAETVLRQNEERQAFLLRLSDAMRAQDDPDAIGRVATRLLAEQLQVDRCYICRFSREAGTAWIGPEYHDGGIAPARGAYRFADFPESMRTLETGGLVVEDLRSDSALSDRDKQSIATMGMNAVLVAALRKVERDFVWAMAAGDSNERRWTDHDRVLLNETAERVWAATERACAQAAALEAQARYLALFNSIDQGFCIIEMKFDEHDRPVDYRFLEVSPSFERQAGIVDGAGRWMRNVAPEHEQFWFDVYGRVARSGESVRFEDYSTPLGRWWSVYAFKVEGPNRVAVLFDDITQRQRDADALRVSKSHLESELKRLTLLHALSNRSVTEERLPALFEEILATAVAIMEADAGTVQAYSPASHSLELLVTQGVEGRMADLFRRIDGASNTACGIALRTGARTFVDFDRQETDEAHRMHVEAGLRSAQATPLLARDGTPIGMINTHWRASGHRPSADQLRFLDLLARQAADLIEQRRADERLRDSEERLRQFGEASSDVLWVRGAVRLQWEYLSPAFEAIYGVPVAQALAGDNMGNWLSLVVEEDRQRALACIERARAGEYVAFEYRIRRPDGNVRWLRDTDFPMRGPGGEVARIGGVGQDVTERKAAEIALRDREARLKTIMETARDYAILTLDADGRVNGWWAGAEAAFGYRADEIIGRDGGLLWTEEDLRRGEDRKERAVARDQGRAPDVRWHVRKDGSRVFIEGMVTPLPGPEGQVSGYLKVGRDMTERHATDERQHVLVAELQHRTRNLMGVVRSVADKTARASVDLDDFRERFRDRLEALARVQGLLSRLNDYDRVAFDELIEAELAAMSGSVDRVRLSGPRGVRLRSSAVQTLAMALHELATNAVKYGALGQPGARLAVTWSLRAREQGGPPWLHIDWRETGVAMPAAGADPRGGGQGRELIERALPYQLGAETTYELGEDGVHCTILIPISATPPRDAGGA